jgi:hypothetical protein
MSFSGLYMLVIGFDRQVANGNAFFKVVWYLGI